MAVLYVLVRQNKGQRPSRANLLSVRHEVAHFNYALSRDGAGDESEITHVNHKTPLL